MDEACITEFQAEVERLETYFKCTWPHGLTEGQLAEEIFQNISMVLVHPICDEFLKKWTSIHASLVLPKVENVETLVQQFINDVIKSPQRDRLRHFFPKVLECVQSFFAVNNLLGNKSSIKQYLSNACVLLEYYCKLTLSYNTNIGNNNDCANLISYIILKFLFFMEGPVMDLIFQLTLWHESSKNYSTLPLLLAIYKQMAIKLFLNGRRPKGGSFAQLSSLNYLRLVLFCSTLKKLSDKKRSSNVTEIMWIKKFFDEVLLTRRSDQCIRVLLPHLTRVFPLSCVQIDNHHAPSNISEESWWVYAAIRSADYQIEESLAGFFDFLQCYDDCFDIDGNVIDDRFSKRVSYKYM